MNQNLLLKIKLLIILMMLLNKNSCLNNDFIMCLINFSKNINLFSGSKLK